MPHNSRIIFALTSLLCFSVVANGQDQSEDSPTAKLERLAAENEKLRSQVIAMALEIQQLKAKLNERQSEAKATDSEPDYLTVGTKWKGRIDGRGAQGGDYHGAAEAIITARTEKGFQIRVKGQEGNEFVVTCEGSKNRYKISELRQTYSPDRNARLGLKLVNSSHVTITAPKSGPPTLKASLVAPRGNSGVTVTYTLQPER